MTNEEKILSMLEKIQSDIDEIKKLLVKEKVQPTAEEQIAAVEGLADMLTDEEKIEFGKFMDETEKLKTRQHQFINALADMLTDEEKDALGRYQYDEDERKAALYG